MPTDSDITNYVLSLHTFDVIKQSTSETSETVETVEKSLTPTLTTSSIDTYIEDLCVVPTIETEDILMENPNRFVMFPIQYHEVWQYYKKALSSFWIAEELSFADDLEQWRHSDKITANDKFFIKHILAFFASADGIVNENLAQNFYTEVQVPEIRAFYGFQIAIENIHGEVYSLLIDTLAESPEEKNMLFHSIQNYESINKMTQWAIKWLKNDAPFNQRLIAFAAVEGILFSGPFCAIFWFKKRGLMSGLTQSNEFISRDENLHMEFACHIHKMLKNPASNDVIIQIIQEAVMFEKQFIAESIPCKLIGMDENLMSNYIEYVADRLLVMLGCNRYYNTKNPFEWMDMISIQNKTNFFEKRVTDYSKSGISYSSLIRTTSSSLIQSTNGNCNSNNNITVIEDF